MFVTYYVNRKSGSNLTYSIDMLRLKTEITYEEFSKIEFRFRTCWKDIIKMNYETTRPSQFHYNYVIELEEGISFWFGFLHNTESKSIVKEDKKYNFTIEFNPNKLKTSHVLIWILQRYHDWVVKSYDVAIDIPVSINSIIIDRGRFKLLQTLDYGDDNKTYFLGRKDGRVKIYNKKRESNLDVRELTRIEISSVETGELPIYLLKQYKFEERLFPQLFLKEYVFSLEDYKDTTLLAILYAVQSRLRYKFVNKNIQKEGKRLIEPEFKNRV